MTQEQGRVDDAAAVTESQGKVSDAAAKVVRAAGDIVESAADDKTTGLAKTNKVKVCVDADGGDDAPKAVIDGVRLALQADKDLSILLVGREESISGISAEFPDRIEPVVTTEVITMADHPAQAVRRKKDSSIVVGCKLVHDGKADAFFSAGSTGACLTGATILIGRIAGVKRPALVTILPSEERKVVFTDVGANADCKPEYLLQFAKMGMAYAEAFLDVQNPTVGLLNNGSEDTKGSAFAVETHDLLAKSLSNFYGNVEGGDLLKGTCDVVVTDGFSGNVALKVIEGTSKFIFKALKNAMTSSFGNKLAAAKLSPSLHAMRGDLDPDAYGGAPLLGTKAVCIVGHGSSNAEAIKNGIEACSKSVRAGLPQKIAEELAKEN